MVPFISLLSELLFIFLVALATKCGIDVQQHQGDLRAVAGTAAVGIVSGLVAVGWRLWVWFNKHFPSSGGGAAMLVMWLLLPAAIAFLPGCQMAASLGTGSIPNITPRQQYNNAAAIYDLAVVGIAIHSKGSPSDAVLKREQDAQAKLIAAGQWLKDNPSQADTPGAAFPPLAPLNVAIDLIQIDLHTLPLVPLSAPATQP
jgi:hypothetical protein